MPASDAGPLPVYKIVGAPPASPNAGMPGRFPAQVASVHSPRALDESNEKIDPAAVKQMMDRGMTALTGKQRLQDAWRDFFDPGDVVGLKLNCVGYPGVYSSPEVVAETVRNLNSLGIPPDRIYLYDRFQSQLASPNYPAYLPPGIHLVGAEVNRGDNRNYDPDLYVEVDFFGEDDTRSNMMRVVSQTVTKIINIPNMKDHGSAGVTGCLKNIAYGSFSNVARSHRGAKTNTYSFIGTLAAVQPLRAKTVLHIMDGIKAVWHGGPFSREKRFRFYPKQMMFGTDPVAIDRLLLDIIDNQRKAEGVISIWDRSPQYLRGRAAYQPDDPNQNVNIREPGHVEYASKLGLGTYDSKKIRLRKLEV
jgi:Domain of unknown function (DUF362)